MLTFRRNLFESDFSVLYPFGMLAVIGVLTFYAHDRYLRYLFFIDIFTSLYFAFIIALVFPAMQSNPSPQPSSSARVVSQNVRQTSKVHWPLRLWVCSLTSAFLYVAAVVCIALH